MNIKAWIIERWDWFIYHLACHSIRRMCERQPGFAYLMELSIRDWLSKNPLPDSLEKATETFHEAMRTSAPATSRVADQGETCGGWK